MQKELIVTMCSILWWCPCVQKLQQWIYRLVEKEMSRWW